MNSNNSIGVLAHFCNKNQWNFNKNDFITSKILKLCKKYKHYWIAGSVSFSILIEKPKEFQSFLNSRWVHDFKILIKPQEFQWFWISPWVWRSILVEKRLEFKVFLNSRWVHDFKLLIKLKEFQWFWISPWVWWSILVENN